MPGRPRLRRPAPQPVDDRLPHPMATPAELPGLIDDLVRHRVIDAYAGPGNGEAVRTAKVLGMTPTAVRDVLRDPQTATLLRQRIAEHSMSLDEALYRLSRIAALPLSDVTSLKDVKFNEHDATLPVYDHAKAKRSGADSYVNGYKLNSAYGVAVPILADRVAALRVIARIHQIAGSALDGGDPTGHDPDNSPEANDLRRQIVKRLARLMGVEQPKSLPDIEIQADGDSE